MRDHLIIYVNGRRHEVAGGRAFQPLSSFLRYHLGLTGTKVVCAEGDCGSCAVLVGRPDESGITYRPITSCIQFVYQLDGTHVVTVEGLKYDGALNPVQESFVRCQGAQCGFCTPGFVVSLCGMLEENRTPDEAAVRAGLTGNLCRCTGYESIINSALEMTGSTRRTDELYPPGAMVEELRAAKGKPLSITAGRRTFFKPVSVAEATKFKTEHPGCMLIAGGTDVGVQVNKGMRDPDVILSLADLSELRGIQLDDGHLIVGALATLSDLERRTEHLCPEFGRMMWRHGSPLIRNAGTLAGNIANASPIGDAMPALMVLNAIVELTGQRGPRRVNMTDFYTGYRQTVMTADELITRVMIPLPGPRDDFRLYKISKRHDLDISSFAAAFWMRRENGVIADIRIAFGGVGPVIYRLRKTEAALIGKPFSEAEIEAVTEIARGEITPISDVRGTAEYRLLLAENILRKFFLEVRGVETFQRTTDPGRVHLAAELAPRVSPENGDAH